MIQVLERIAIGYVAIAVAYLLWEVHRVSRLHRRTRTEAADGAADVPTQRSARRPVYLRG